MTLDQIFFLLIAMPTALWMTFHSCQTSSVIRSIINALTAPLFLLAFCLPCAALQNNTVTAGMIARAVASLSDSDLKHRSRPELSECPNTD